MLSSHCLASTFMRRPAYTTRVYVSGEAFMGRAIDAKSLPSKSAARLSSCETLTSADQRVLSKSSIMCSTGFPS